MSGVDASMLKKMGKQVKSIRSRDVTTIDANVATDALTTFVQIYYELDDSTRAALMDKVSPACCNLLTTIARYAWQ